MASRPQDDPLGATPMLPPPEGQSAVRAEQAFATYLDQQASVAPPASHSGRRYDLALKAAYGEGAEPTAVGPAAPAPASGPDEVGSGQGESVAEDLPVRPPVGARAIRPSVRPPRRLPVEQDLLERAADGALLVAGPDGSTSFEIAFRDQLLGELACRITWNEGRVVAVFRAVDQNLRRLIEAEAGRLRVALEGRGLKVEDVRVELLTP